MPFFYVDETLKNNREFVLKAVGLNGSSMKYVREEFKKDKEIVLVKSLKKINLNKLSNKFHFDTQIIIQFINKKFKIKEIPIPTIYRDEISHLKSIPYGINVLLSTIKAGYR